MPNPIRKKVYDCFLVTDIWQANWQVGILICAYVLYGGLDSCYTNIIMISHTLGEEIKEFRKQLLSLCSNSNQISCKTCVLSCFLKDKSLSNSDTTPGKKNVTIFKQESNRGNCGHYIISCYWGSVRCY